jgi:hypothetical protein
MLCLSGISDTFKDVAAVIVGWRSQQQQDLLDIPSGTKPVQHFKELEELNLIG